MSGGPSTISPVGVSESIELEEVWRALMVEVNFVDQH